MAASELAAVLGGIFAGLFLLLWSVAWCTIKRFRPEGSIGAPWYPGPSGEPRRVLGPGEKAARPGAWLVSAEQTDA